MRLIFVTTSLDMGGAEVLLVNLLKQLVNKNDIKVVYLKGKGTLIPLVEQFGIYPVKITKLLNLNVVNSVFKHNNVMRGKVIIQGWMYHGNIIATIIHILMIKHSQLIWSIHHSAESLQAESWLMRAKLQINAILSRLAYKVIYVSSQVKEDHIAAGFCKTNALVINNGIDTNHFIRNTSLRSYIRDKIGIKNSSTVFGIIGRNHPLKGYHIFFAGAAILLKQFTDIEFVVIGRDIHISNYTNELKELDDEQIARIHILGERDDVNHLLSSMDFYVCTSISEAFPLSVLEALSSELICVSSDIICYKSDFPKAVLTFPVGDVLAFVEAVKSLLTISIDLRHNIGWEARQKVIENYSIERVAHSYSSLWEEFYKR